MNVNLDKTGQSSSFLLQLTRLHKFLHKTLEKVVCVGRGGGGLVGVYFFLTF